MVILFTQPHFYMSQSVAAKRHNCGAIKRNSPTFWNVRTLMDVDLLDKVDKPEVVD